MTIMDRFMVIEGPGGHHWVLARRDMVVAAGPVVTEAEARRQLAMILQGDASPQLIPRGRGWVWAFIDQQGDTLGVGLRRHSSLDACLDDCVLALMPESLEAPCAHPKRQVA